MQRISVICSFNTKDTNHMRPLYFIGETEDGERMRIKVQRVLRTNNKSRLEHGFFTGTQVRYVDKIVFECQCVIYSQLVIVLLLYDPGEQIWYLEET